MVSHSLGWSRVTRSRLKRAEVLGPWRLKMIRWPAQRAKPQAPWSRRRMVPAPYWPSGISPSKGEPLHGGILRKAFRHRPTPENAALLQAAVEVVVSGVAPLDDEARLGREIAVGGCAASSSHAPSSVRQFCVSVHATRSCGGGVCRRFGPPVYTDFGNWFAGIAQGRSAGRGGAGLASPRAGSGEGAEALHRPKAMSLFVCHLEEPRLADPHPHLLDAGRSDRARNLRGPA